MNDLASAPGLVELTEDQLWEQAGGNPAVLTRLASIRDLEQSLLERQDADAISVLAHLAVLTDLARDNAEVMPKPSYAPSARAKKRSYVIMSGAFEAVF